MNILGINAYHGNASAAIVCDGKLIAAVEEERFNRVKYAAGFPAMAIRYCLQAAGITLADVDHVAVPRDPYARIPTKLFYSLRMPAFARDRAKVLVKFTGIPEALAGAFDCDPKKLKARFHRVERPVGQQDRNRGQALSLGRALFPGARRGHHRLQPHRSQLHRSRAR